MFLLCNVCAVLVMVDVCVVCSGSDGGCLCCLQCW